jgi:ribosomal protein S18 acetylase RimI-like enzyme
VLWVTEMRLEPMTEEQYRAYREFAEEDYAGNIAKSGAMSLADAVEKSAADFGRLLPKGLATPDHFLWTGYDGDVEVGVLWLRIEPKPDGLHAFGFDFWVQPDLRRRGYGRAMMAAAERICRERGVVSVGLSVFGFNAGAQSLYEQMGFEVTAIRMSKRL